MLSNLEIVTMATEDGPCVDANLGAKGSDRCLLQRFEAPLLRKAMPLDCSPFPPCSRTQSTAAKVLYEAR
jgi:hypothetical protein